MIEQGTVDVTRSLRYAIRNAASTPVHLIYLLHGYGQLAHYFLRKVEHLFPENVCFVAPEGMHRFYQSGTAGRVGASWMTREARELDITENTHALNKLHEQLEATLQPQKIIVIGFSQGGATAARWIADGKVNTDCFISWASVYPPDLGFPEQATFQPSKNLFVLGTSDQFFNEEAVEQASKDYLQRGFEIVRFEGGHDLDAAVLEHLIQSI